MESTNKVGHSYIDKSEAMDKPHSFIIFNDKSTYIFNCCLNRLILQFHLHF